MEKVCDGEESKVTEDRGMSVSDSSSTQNNTKSSQELTVIK